LTQACFPSPLHFARSSAEHSVSVVRAR
jgi:hypothetical protein